MTISITRRVFVACATATLLLASTSAYAYQEAPMLAKRVAAGELPPVEERLPANPRVIEPVNEIGTYGGTWRRGFSGRSDDRGPQKLMEPRIVRFVQSEPGKFELVNNWVDEIQVNDNSTEFTFKIRDGLRWSDGQPATTEDVQFYFDVISSEIGADNGRYPGTLVSGGERGILTIQDELTFSVAFSAPHPLFLQRLGRDYTWMIFPKHYMAQFTPMYASQEDLAKRAAEFGVETYMDLWGRRGVMQSFWLNPDVPTLAPWTITTPPDGEVAIFTRNPYYHAVDTAGNQLPYIDKIRHDLFQDKETLNLWIAQGRIDLQGRHVQVNSYPFYVENAEAGNYRVAQWKQLIVETLWPNQTTRDPVLAELFQNPEFREAINIAIDRDTINEISYAGFGEAMQAGPGRGSQIFSEDLLTKWREFDPERANALLDGLGLDQRDADNYRLRKDGKRLSVTITTPTQFDVEPLELVSADWEAIGIEVEIEAIERSLYLDRMAANEVEVGRWGMGRSANILIAPGAYGNTLDDSPWSLGWRAYRAEPESPIAVAPPEGHMLYDVWDLLDRASVAGSQAEAFELGQQVLELHAKEPNWVGLVGGYPYLFIVSDRVGNFPEGYIRDDLTRDLGIIPTEQLFIRQ